MESGAEYVIDKIIVGDQRKKYAKRHGIDSLINAFHGLPWNDKESERVYKICNDRGITWEQFYGIKSHEVIY